MFFPKKMFPIEVRAEFSTEDSPHWEISNSMEKIDELTRRVQELELQAAKSAKGAARAQRRKQRRDERRGKRAQGDRADDAQTEQGSQAQTGSEEDAQTEPAPSRTAKKGRVTKETKVEVELNLDGSGKVAVSTGLPFFDHMLDQLGRHGGFDLSVKARGDLAIDAHHTVEDTGIVLGGCLAEALGDKVGVRRFASMSVPLDEALVNVSVDLSGRPYLCYEVEPPGEKILGERPFDPQLMEEFWRAFATAAALTLHIVMVRGRNTHHIMESSFKGVARSLRDAVKIESDSLPSTKGAL